jgi:hypothetical protein
MLFNMMKKICKYEFQLYHFHLSTSLMLSNERPKLSTVPVAMNVNTFWPYFPVTSTAKFPISLFVGAKLWTRTPFHNRLAVDEARGALSLAAYFKEITYTF